MAGNLTQKDFARSNPIDLSTITDPISSWVKMMHLHDSQFQCCAPAVVLEYDKNTNEALVQPIIRIKTNLDNSLPRKPITIQVIGLDNLKTDDEENNDSLISSIIYPGVYGWMIASDYDTYMGDELSKEKIKEIISSNSDKALDDYVDQITMKSPTNNIHQYRNGFFIPESIFTSVNGLTGNISLVNSDGEEFEVDKENNRIIIEGTGEGGGGGGGGGGGSSGVTSLNTLTGNVGIISSDGSINISVSGQDINLTKECVTQLNGLINGVNITSPDDSIDIQVNGQDLELKCNNDGTHTDVSNFNYNTSNHTVSAGYVRAGRRLVYLNAITITNTTTYLSVRVNHSGNGLSGEWVYQGPSTNSQSLDFTIIPIYLFNDFKIINDYRNIPCFTLYE